MIDGTDQTIPLARRGYRWGSELRAGRSAVRTRLLGRSAVLVGGPEGVRRFYDPRLQRHNAFPPPIKLVLFGPGAVHGLDDAAHHQRKALFTDLLRGDALHGLGARADRTWDDVAGRWPVGEQRAVFPLAVETIARIVLPWAGVRDTDDRDVVRRGRRLAGVVDGFVRPVVPYLRAVGDRIALDRWAAGLIGEVRAGRRDAAPGTALRAAAEHRDTGGDLLPAHTAGVEFLNVVRPSIAAAWFVTFAAMALQHDRDLARRVVDRPDLRYAFGQEVRRFYPFVPALLARTRHPQDVLGHPLGRNAFVVLDVYGTNHDPAAWGDPEEFRPDRFLTDRIDPDAFVPQGGGEMSTGHRCPGEDVVLIMIMSAIRALGAMVTELPPQRLAWRVSPLPTRPDSGVVLRRLG